MVLKISILQFKEHIFVHPKLTLLFSANHVLKSEQVCNNGVSDTVKNKLNNLFRKLTRLTFFLSFFIFRDDFDFVKSSSSSDFLCNRIKPSASRLRSISEHI